MFFSRKLSSSAESHFFFLRNIIIGYISRAARDIGMSYHNHPGGIRIWRNLAEIIWKKTSSQSCNGEKKYRYWVYSEYR